MHLLIRPLGSRPSPTRLMAILAVLILTTPIIAGEAPRRANVVLIVADDLRPDALGFSGNAQIKTTHLDRLAQRGAVFSRATCGYPICNVSRSEMFAGRILLGSEVNRNNQGGLKFDPQWTLWPEHMKRSGWHTVYSGKWHVTGSPWLNGFVETAGLYSGGGGQPGVKATIPKTPTGRAVTGYTGWTFKTDKNEPLPALGVGLTPQTDGIVADRAIDAIRRAGDKPLFMQINFIAPHDPLHWPAGQENAIDYRTLTLPANFREAPSFDTGNVAGRDERIVPAPRTAEEVKKERAIYFTLVENVDRQVGKIVQALEETGQLGHTIIIVTSDHGLALGSHGLMGKQNQYDHTINVPLLMAGPGIPTGQRFAAQCYLRDLYPTICELTGLMVPPSVQGLSLVPVLRGEKTEVRDAIFGYFTETQRMIRMTDGWKLIWYPKIEKLQLFDLANDPSEQRDLAAAPGQAERIERMKGRLGQWQREHNDPAPSPRLALPAP
ncbi:MAG: hypothetical protein RL077_1209 [Verrucomicrobiota bacterium]